MTDSFDGKGEWDDILVKVKPCLCVVEEKEREE